MSPQTLPPLTADDIRLDLISGSEWRVCDRRIPANDSRSVVGFIERHEFEYEVISVIAPGPVRSFGSLSTATLSFAAV